MGVKMKKSIMVFAALLMLAAGARGSEPSIADFWADKFNASMKLAEQGDAEAQYTVANMYERGKGTAADSEQALVWYRKAAEKGLDKAEYKIGYFYFKGIGVSKNLKEAITWLHKAADKGYAPAQFHLGWSYAELARSDADYDTALKWLNTARDNGYASADSKISEVKAQREALSATPSVSATPAAAPESTTTAKSTGSAAPASPPEETLTPLALVLRGGWRDVESKPSIHLPSALTACQRARDTLVCTTQTLQRAIPAADITYQVETTIDIDQTTGKLNLVARNNILEVSPNSHTTDPVNIKPGWQYTKKYMDCELKDKNRIVCGRGGFDAVEYTREGS